MNPAAGKIRDETKGIIFNKIILIFFGTSSSFTRIHDQFIGVIKEFRVEENAMVQAGRNSFGEHAMVWASITHEHVAISYATCLW